jgi:hypothetical protein
MDAADPDRIVEQFVVASWKRSREPATTQAADVPLIERTQLGLAIPQLASGPDSC